MNVTVEKKDSLNALMTVEIQPEDYKKKVDSVLSDYRRKANIPGFRPGHVPQSLIKKQYGKAVLIEEVNHILQHAVYDHIKDEKLDILGNPIPVLQTDIDWDKEEKFSFEFELGLTPEFTLNFNNKTKVPFYKIVADKKMVDRYVEDYAKRYGTMSSPEAVEDDTIIKAQFTEVSKDGSTSIEGGIAAEASFNTESISDKKSLKSLTGKKVGEKIVVDAKKAFSKDFNLAKQLGVEADALESSSGMFEVEIKEISKITPAELNQELFDKIFGEGEVKSEKEFRERIKNDAEQMFVGESDRKFYEDAKDIILSKMDFDLPEEFLKKWMQNSGEKPASREEVDKQYPEMKDNMKWQLVENKVVKENNIEVSEQELLDYTKALVGKQMAQYGQAPADEELVNIAQRVMENKDEVQRITDQLFTEKLISFFKESLKLNEKEVSFDDFLKEMQK